MTERIRLVQNDSRPAIVVNIMDGSTGNTPLNLTGATVRLKVRRLDELTVISVLVASIVNGANGQCVFFPALAPEMMQDFGNFKGEVEITFEDGQVQTVYDLISFTVREEF